jgi:Flp pilus assembly protein TadD
VDQDLELELALDLIDGGQVEPGIRGLEQVLRERPDEVRALFGLGHAYASQGRREEAERCFGRLCDIIPDALDALDAYAQALGALGRVDEALAVTARMAELPGHEGTAAFRAGLVLAGAGRLDDARARLDDAYRLEFGRPRRRTISFEHGRLLVVAGRPAAALALFERASKDSAEVESEEQAEEMERLRAECAAQTQGR